MANGRQIKIKGALWLTVTVGCLALHISCIRIGVLIGVSVDYDPEVQKPLAKESTNRVGVNDGVQLSAILYNEYQYFHRF